MSNNLGSVAIIISLCIGAGGLGVSIYAMTVIGAQGPPGPQGEQGIPGIIQIKSITINSTDGGDYTTPHTVLQMDINVSEGSSLYIIGSAVLRLIGQGFVIYERILLNSSVVAFLVVSLQNLLNEDDHDVRVIQGFRSNLTAGLYNISFQYWCNAGDLYLGVGNSDTTLTVMEIAA